MSFARLEAFIFDRMSESKLPGLSAALVRDGQVIWARGFGFRDVERGLAATPHTLYGIGSVTKSFTVIAILQLAEAGKLSVDDPVEKHIPEFTIRPGGEPVRLWHLMTHTSGLPALAYAESVIDAATGARESWLPLATAADMLTFLREAGDWALNKPGERWFYLNEGYVLLGHIVEVCAGLPYTQYVTERILQPLGLTRSFFARAEVEGDPDAATPYLITDEGQRRPSTYAWGAVTADGGLISHVLDMAKYIAMFLNQGAYEGGQLLSRQSLAAMQTPRITTPLQNSPFGDTGYGYGLAIIPDFLGRRLVGHGGSVGTATAQMSFLPDENVGMMVLANGSGYPLSQIAMYGLALLLGEDPDALYFARREARLAGLEGRYETYKGTVRMQVRRAGDFLFLEESHQFGTIVTPLVPEDLGETVRTFYTLRSGLRLPVEFRVRDDGLIELIVERYLLRRTGRLT